MPVNESHRLADVLMRSRAQSIYEESLIQNGQNQQAATFRVASVNVGKVVQLNQAVAVVKARISNLITKLSQLT